jgi:hypothetical protein
MPVSARDRILKGDNVLNVPTPASTKKPTQKPTVAPKPTAEPTAEPSAQVKAIRKTSEYNLFRKYLVSKGHRLAQKDVGLMWGEVNKPSSEGTKSLWQRSRDVARTEGAKPTNASRRLNSDEGFLRYLQLDGTFNKEISETLQQRCAGLADSRANDILDGSTDAQTVIKPTLGDGKGATTPINDPFLDSISNIVGGGGQGGDPSGTTATGMKRTNDGYTTPSMEQASRGTIRNAGGGRIDTTISTDPITGSDTVTSGPKTVNVATKTLRSQFGMAPGDAVKPDLQVEATSNVIAETWGWVPPNTNDNGPTDLCTSSTCKKTLCAPTRAPI